MTARSQTPLTLACLLFVGTLVALPAPAAAQACGGLYEPLCREEVCTFALPIVGCLTTISLPSGAFGGCDNANLNPNILSNECQPCGGDGQAPCPYRANRCDPFHNDFFARCSACGGNGQGVCLTEPACKPGHVAVGPVCVNRGHAEEPTEGLAVFSPLPLLSQPDNEPVKGLADLHTHQFADLGFGGALFHGKAYDPSGINAALPWCDFTHTPTFLPGKIEIPELPVLGYAKHGPSGVLNLVSHATTEGMHEVSGRGPFSGWPKWSSITHQQMYHTWLRRAWLGGLRLMVMHAVSNKALCDAGITNGGSCEDMPAVDAQLEAAKEFEAAIDAQAGGTGRGWYRIAYSPQEAREIIRSGRLAVILGIEVDSLFGCKVGTDCSAEYVKSELARYYAKGVRHVFPVHVFDNAFGGTAIYSDLFNSGNVLVNSQYLDVDVNGCSVDFEMGSDMLSTVLNGVYQFLDDAIPTYGIGTALKAKFGTLNPPLADYAASVGDCNRRGLSAIGETLITEMMNLGMIIDVDHMSRKTRDAVYALARARGYPLVSGHSSFAALAEEGHTSEYGLTADDIATLKELGGMVTIPPPRGPVETTADYKPFYDYVIEEMRDGPFDPSAQHPGIAFSTDFNGFVPQTAPRFGAEAPAGAADAGPRINYAELQNGEWWIGPIRIPVPTLGFTGPLGGVFTVQKTGDRAFDFNTQGLAHVGLLPDFFRDLKNVGFSDADLEPMFNSAETYIQMWTRTHISAARPIVTVEIDGDAGQNGWYTSDVHVAFSIVDFSGASTTSGCEATTIAEDTPGMTLTCIVTPPVGDPVIATATIRRDATAPLFAFDGRNPAAGPFGWNNSDVTLSLRCEDATSGPAENPGAGNVHLVTHTIASDGRWPSMEAVCSDAAGNSAVAETPEIRIDKTPPSLELRLKTAPNAAGWVNTPVELVWDCVDNLSGLTAAPGSVSLPDGSTRTLAIVQQIGEEGANVSASTACTDRAGNSTTHSVDGLKIDLTAPVLTLVGRQPAANAAGWHNTPVTVTWTCADALSGVDGGSLTLQDHVTGEGAGQQASASCADIAGNTASMAEDGIDIDMTPPVVSTLQTPLANEFGWNKSAVTIAFSAIDALSGVNGDAEARIMLAGEGSGQSREWTFVDRAGNAASARHGGVNIDLTPPMIQCQAAPDILFPANRMLMPVDVTLAFSDALAGTDDYQLTAARSSDPISINPGDPEIDIDGFVVGTRATSGRLRAQRIGAAERIYTLEYAGADRAGNTAACSAVVRVPVTTRGSF